MIRNTLFLSCLLVATAACDWTVPESEAGESTDADTEAPTVDTVRNRTAAVCSFLPSEETAMGIIALNEPRLSTAVLIGKAICDALARQAATPGSGLPEVGGVIISGEPA